MVSGARSMRSFAMNPRLQSGLPSEALGLVQEEGVAREFATDCAGSSDNSTSSDQIC